MGESGLMCLLIFCYEFIMREMITGTGFMRPSNNALTHNGGLFNVAFSGEDSYLTEKILIPCGQ